MAKAPPESLRFDQPTPPMTAKILIVEPPRTTALHLAMKGRWGGCARCYLGWLTGYEMATQVPDFIEELRGASFAVPLSVPPTHPGRHETNYGRTLPG
jgi:hypothetical protein